MHIQTQITIRTLLRLTKIACDPPPHITYESLTIDINMSCMDNYKQITLGKITLRIELYMKIARGHILSPYTPPPGPSLKSLTINGHRYVMHELL